MSNSGQIDYFGEQFGRMLQSFIESHELQTLLVRGSWGVGKTFELTKFISNYNFEEKSNLVAKSIVSLFGKQTLIQIQREIFSKASRVGSVDATKNRIGNAATKHLQLQNYIEGTKSNKFAKWFSSKASAVEVPWIGAVGEIIGQGNYDLIDGFLVVLDDLERRSDLVPMRDILGLIDELSTRKGCKVIVICNEDVLESDDRKLLEDFKEKVFDLEFLIERSPLVISKIGLPADFPFYEVAEQIWCALGVSNIRVVKRFAFLANQIWPDIKDANPIIIKEVLEHIAILVWACYDASSGISKDKLSSLTTDSSWIASAIKQKSEEKPQWQINWEAAATSIQFNSRTYDNALIEYLRTGIWVPGVMSDDISSQAMSLQQIDASVELRKAWNIYTDNFSPDMDLFVTKLQDTIDIHGEMLSVRDVDSAFAILEDLKVDITNLAKKYIANSSSLINQAAVEDWPFEGFKSSVLKPVINKARESGKLLPTIDAALSNVSLHRSWSEEDITALSECSDKDLFNWIMSNPDKLSYKIRHGLLYFKSQSSDDRYAIIGKKAERVLRKVAKLSDFNEIRVSRMFNISTDLDENISE